MTEAQDEQQQASLFLRDDDPDTLQALCKGHHI
jgi:hypothetical protein